MSNESHEDRELEDLLPWYAAGALSRTEAQRIEAALARDPELSNRLSLVQEELTGTIQVNESLSSPSPRAMQQLFEKIDAEPVRLRPRTRSLSAHIASIAAGLSPGTRFAMAIAAAIVIAVQTAVIGAGLLHMTNNTYETASAPAATTTQGSFVLVRFAQQATAANVTAFLESNRAAIVDGPLGGGIYRLRVSRTVLTKEVLSGIVLRMQRDPTVSFVVASE
jgi:hypothetical protein